MFNDRNDCCGCHPLCKEPTTLPYEKCNDCDKTKGIPMPESFFEGVKLLNTIEKDQLPPFTIRLSKLPFNDKGMFTIDWKEIFWYEYDKNNSYSKQETTNTQWEKVEVLVPVSDNKPGEPGEVTITKRGLHPSGTFNGLNGEWNWYVDIKEDGLYKRYNADYNNCKFMYRHRANSDVSIDINHLHIRMATAMTCCRPATQYDCGTVKISKVCPDSGDCPIAVSICDFANCGKLGIVRELSKCVPEGREIAVAWNDYATETRPGLTQVTDVRVRDCNTGAITTQALLTGDNIPVALNAYQFADKDVYGSVTLSIGGSNHIAHAANHHANTETAGLVKLREIRQRTYKYQNESELQRFWDPLTNCWNKAKYVISDLDFADATTHWLVRLSNPSDCTRNDRWEFLQTQNIAVNKEDYATPTNQGVVRLSKDSCRPCNPIVVADNDERMFFPYMEIFDQVEGGVGAVGQLTMGTSLTGKTTLTTNNARTNITSWPNAWCEKNSRYYWFDKAENELFIKEGQRYKSIIIPKEWLWKVDFQVRLVIDPYLRNYKWANPISDIVSQARVQYKEPGGNEKFTPIGFKEHFTHHEFTKDMVAVINSMVGRVAGVDKSWREEWTSQFAGEIDCGYDSFLESSGLFWFKAGTEVFMSCDLDIDTSTNYAPYRQRLHLTFVDSVRVEMASH